MDPFRLDNEISIATAEGIRIEFNLAGLATRMLAAAIDLFIYFAIAIGIWFALLPVFLGLGDDGSQLVFAILTMATVAGFVLYPTMFEAFGGGKTPGKRVMGIKVLTAGGYPPTFATILTRNLVRLADFFPGVYLAGAISILATNHSQRLGDLVAGTIVVREPTRSCHDDLPLVTPDEAVWDVSQVTKADVLAIRHFLNRAPELSVAVRNLVANQLATTIYPRVSVTTYSPSAEAFLRKVAYDKTNRS